MMIKTAMKLGAWVLLAILAGALWLVFAVSWLVHELAEWALDSVMALLKDLR